MLDGWEMVTISLVTGVWMGNMEVSTHAPEKGATASAIGLMNRRSTV